MYLHSTCFFFGPMTSRLVALQMALAKFELPNAVLATSSLSATDIIEFFVGLESLQDFEQNLAPKKKD